MAHKRLSKMDDYDLVHSSQDIRGHSMMDADGNTIGTVDDLIVDTNANRVDTIVLDDGQEFSASEIEIDDKNAYLKGTRTSTDTGDPTGDDSDRVVRVYGDAHVQSGRAAFSDYDETFRTHHKKTYDEDDYATYEPAYRHGYEYGTGERYADRDYDALEPEMRKSYEQRHGEGTWANVKDAVRHGFTSSRTHHDEKAGVSGATGSGRTASGDPGSAMREE